MSRRGKAAVGIIFAAAIAVLAWSSWSLVQIHLSRKAAAQQVREQNEDILARLRALLPDTTEGSVNHGTQNDEDAQTAAGQSLKMMEIGGFSCVGILEIPVRDLAWAVADESSDTDDCFLPVVTDGCPSDGDLMIRGFNNEAQFAVLQDAAVGNEVTFTDVNGVVYTYEVVSTGRLPYEQVKKTLEGASTGLVITAEALQETDQIDLQLYFEMGAHDRYVVDCRAVDE